MYVAPKRSTLNTHTFPSQIHLVFAYYYDHQTELEADIRRRRECADQMAAEAPETPDRKQMYEQRLRV